MQNEFEGLHSAHRLAFSGLEENKFVLGSFFEKSFSLILILLDEKRKAVSKRRMEQRTLVVPTNLFVVVSCVQTTLVVPNWSIFEISTVIIKRNSPLCTSRVFHALLKHLMSEYYLFDSRPNICSESRITLPAEFKLPNQWKKVTQYS